MKVSAPAIITSREVIIAGYDAILDQSDQQNLYNHLSNYTNISYPTRASLRAVVSNFRESGDRSENSNFFLFAPKDPFGELFSKIIFKSSSEFFFSAKIRKVRNRPQRARWPDRNYAN